MDIWLLWHTMARITTHILISVSETTLACAGVNLSVLARTITSGLPYSVLIIYIDCKHFLYHLLLYWSWSPLTVPTFLTVTKCGTWPCRSGIASVAHITLETLSYIKESDRIFYLVCDPVTEAYIQDNNHRGLLRFERFLWLRIRDDMIHIYRCVRYIHVSIFPAPY